MSSSEDWGGITKLISLSRNDGHAYNCFTLSGSLLGSSSALGILDLSDNRHLLLL